MTKVLAAILALAAPLLFPAFLAAAVVFFASLILPPLALFAGVLTDALYYTPAVSFPYATALGAGVSIISYFVHDFIKTRIMG